MPYLSRSLAVLFSLWFAMVLGDPGVLHSCAMHGGAHGAHGAMAMAGAAMHHHDGMSAEMAGAEHQGSPANSHEKAPASCTCVGHCCATTAPVPLQSVATIEVPTLDVPHAAPIAASVIGATVAPEHSLPFANGPPAV